MTVEIICVGTEILMGNIVNTNAAFLAENCVKLGLTNYYQVVVGDNESRLTEVIKTAKDRADVIILSGGLGPTEDDLTKETASKVYGLELVEDEAALSSLKDFFEKRNLEMTENNLKQALVPKGSIVLQNPNGTAPGIIIEEENSRCILLPGPPNELIPMFNEMVAPYLKELQGGHLISDMVKICGIGESKVETMIKDLIDAQSNPTIATYAKTGEVHLRVSAFAETEKEARKLLKPVVKELKSRFGAYIYTTEENISLEQSVYELLKINDLTISAAESCTGGLFTARLVNVPGVSEIYKEGFLTYSNKAKRKLLGVKKSTIEKYGAVSTQCAEEMVKGLCKVTKAECGVSITGIAGPDGGTKEKPVGLVYIGVCVNGHTSIKEYNFKGNRNKIREQSVAFALIQLREMLLKYFSAVKLEKK